MHLGVVSKINKYIPKPADLNSVNAASKINPEPLNFIILLFCFLVSPFSRCCFPVKIQVTRAGFPCKLRNLDANQPHIFQTKFRGFCQVWNADDGFGNVFDRAHGFGFLRFGRNI